MKKIFIILIFSYLSINICYCQLLSKPSLKVKDFEKALTNADQLSKKLKRHNFKYSTEGESKFSGGYTIVNPLVPDLKALRSEDWQLNNNKDLPIFRVNIYEWEPNHAPQPEVIKTIRVMINRNSVYADKMDKFIEKIKNKYPNKGKRYFRNTELYQGYGDPLTVFTNDSKIEVRAAIDTSYGPFYTVSFDLIK